MSEGRERRIILNDTERRVLRALWASAVAYNHVFGRVEDARTAVEYPLQLGGYITSLVKKGLIVKKAREPRDEAGGPWTPFEWGVPVPQIEALLQRRVLRAAARKEVEP